jgi:hypothetical protein
MRATVCFPEMLIDFHDNHANARHTWPALIRA